jgi:ADP-ribose pyrophosphatase YjhB (NUDIX family)
MQLKVLVIGVIRNDSKVLLRKKPDGSPPYTQTWYLFGGEMMGDFSPEQAIQRVVKQQAGVDIRMVEQVGWDTEIKADIDGVVKHFIYLDVLCEYVGGELVAGEGIEKLEWVEIDYLDKYDHVPPSLKLLEKLGYIKSDL